MRKGKGGGAEGGWGRRGGAWEITKAGLRWEKKSELEENSGLGGHTRAREEKGKGKMKGKGEAEMKGRRRRANNLTRYSLFLFHGISTC